MYFRTRAELERQMEAARQLRAETLGGARLLLTGLGGARWLLTGLTSAFLLLRRSVRSRGPGTARRA